MRVSCQVETAIFLTACGTRDRCFAANDIHQDTNDVEDVSAHEKTRGYAALVHRPRLGLYRATILSLLSFQLACDPENPDAQVAQQAIEAAGDNAPVVITRQNRDSMDDALVIMRLGDWVKFYGAVVEAENAA